MAVFLFNPALISAQHRRDPRLLIEGGFGVNLSYFDVGGGTPGPSFQGGASFDLHPNLRLGASVSFHRTRGRDRGTLNEDRNYAYSSNLKEVGIRASYCYKPPYRSQHPVLRRFEPRAYAGLGILQIQDIKNSPLTGRTLKDRPPDIAPVFSLGAGLAFRLNKDLSLAMEGGTNLTTSDYLEGFGSGQFSTSKDLFHSLIVKLSYRVESFE
ncbi:MAG: hypothetical protein CSA96_01775 [Bacteroidetes bacterium]|nr:MAG: hypothetical protein CSA96_01775 [Bacteroidota bacterium]